METRNTFVQAPKGSLFVANGENGRAYPFDEREYKRQYKKAHPEQRRAESHNRRARIREAGGSLTNKECAAVFAKYGKACLRCGSTENITLDHVVPLAAGGTNTADNLQPLCMMCNSNKGVAIADYR